MDWEDAEQRRLMKRLGIKGKARGAATETERPGGGLDLDKLFEGFEDTGSDTSDGNKGGAGGGEGAGPRLKRPRRGGSSVSASDSMQFSGSDGARSGGYSSDERGGSYSSEEKDRGRRGTSASPSGGSYSGASDDYSGESDYSDEEPGAGGRALPGEPSGRGASSPDGSDSSPSSDSPAERDGQRYLPPHLRGREAGADGGVLRLRRKVRGLLNRMTAANLGPIVGDLVLLRGRGALERRHVAAEIVGEVLRIGSAGARAALQGAAVAAACVASFAGQVHDLGVGLALLTELAERLEAVLGGGDGSGEHGACGGAGELEPDYQAGVYLVLMVSHAFTVGLAAPRVVFSLLTHLCRRFGEQDVSLMYHVLRSVGAELRAADPAGLRDFIVAVQEQADRRRGAAVPGAGVGGGGGSDEPMSHRHRTLLQVILEVKNNSQKWSMGAARHAVPADVVKFVHRSGVGGVVIDAEWSKLLDGSALARFGEKTAAGVEDFGLDDSDDDLGLQLVGERSDLLKLAAAQRMNTDIRRKVFCALMGAEDYLDAVDRVLSLGLRGAQEREISRVLVDCCLQEKAYNPFYRLVAKSLCAHSKQHRVSFRYALADQIKELGSSESPRRGRNLMRLAGGLAADGQVPLLVLQALPWEEGVSKGMQAALCSFVEAFFLDGGNEAVGGAFLRLSSSPGLETLRNGLALFLHGTFQRRILRAPERQQRLLLGRYKAALSGLNDDGGAW